MTDTQIRKNAPLGIRIVLIACAVLALAFGVLAGLNLNAMRSYNQATVELTKHIEEAKKPDADLKTLKTQQEQTQAQLDEASRMHAVLLPEISSSIAQNSLTSKELTKRIDEALNKQNNQQNSSNTSNEQESNTSSNTQLSEAQRKEIEEMLKQNEAKQQEQEAGDPNEAQQNESKPQQHNNSTVKPW